MISIRRKSQKLYHNYIIYVVIFLITVLLVLQLNTANLPEENLIGQAVDILTGFTYISCEEDDGGLKLFVKGSAQDEYLNRQNIPRNRVLTDECVDANTIRERYCDGNRLRSKKFTCNNGCDDGACKGDFTYISCSDSDSGKDLFVKGVAEDEYLNRQNIPRNRVLTDECVDENTVRERYCDGNRLRSNKFDCPNGCIDGACRVNFLEPDNPIREDLFISSFEILDGENEINSDNIYDIGITFNLQIKLTDRSGTRVDEALIKIENRGFEQYLELECDEINGNANLGTNYLCLGEYPYFSGRYLGPQTYNYIISVENYNDDEISITDEVTISHRLSNPEFCKELIPEHNIPDADRVNVVFVGYGYADGYRRSAAGNFKAVSQFTIDFNSERNGLFSVKPFVSNQEKFNFWYIDNVKPNYCTNNICDNILLTASDCNYDNKYVLGLINEELQGSSGSLTLGVPINCDMQLFDNCANADLDSDGCVSSSDTEIFYSNRSDLNNDGEIDFIDNELIRYCNEHNYGCNNEIACEFNPRSQDLLIHEFGGHAFADLADEYVLYPNSFFEGETSYNCYSGPEGTYEECIENSPWKHLIGNGCGQVGILDCDNELEPDWGLEVGCWEGCMQGRGIFRSTRYNQMNGGYEFGLWNEHLIQQRLNEFSGE